MKKKKQFLILRQKSYLTAGVITLTAVVAMAGIYYKDKSAKKETEREAVVLADAEKKNTTAKSDTKNRTEKNNTLQNASEAADSVKSDTVQTQTSAANAQAGQKTAAAIPKDAKETQETSASVKKQLHFSSNDSIIWPVNGDVILNYSMDQSVYFATLDQYKYNPALVIASDVSTKVRSVAEAKVVSISNSEETGLTVKVDLGDNYVAIYGQLKDVEVEKGAYISKGEVIGYVSEPTKYYSVEGSNLYFAMTKDGKPVNPATYFGS